MTRDCHAGLVSARVSWEPTRAGAGRRPITFPNDSRLRAVQAFHLERHVPETQLQIVLMRHGKPEIEKQRRLNAMDFGTWVEQYNAAGVDTGCRPPQAAVEKANDCAFAVCSNLPRSLESAKALGIGGVGISDPMFREMEMPSTAWRFPTLPVTAWSVIFRLAWAFGYSKNVESFKAAKERARRCAEHLVGLASVHGTVLFVGHGSLNWFIAKHLKSMGWSCAEKPPRKYWEFSVFHNPAK